VDSLRGDFAGKNEEFYIREMAIRLKTIFSNFDQNTI
jgi:hypothetical protein